ncbi:Cytochrome P450 3A6 [Halotydeus destructor]|nr:Cytochrome P450 3A6 [Halotydeus destructor]
MAFAEQVFFSSIALIAIGIWYYRRKRTFQLLARNGIPSDPCSFLDGHVSQRRNQNVPKSTEWQAKHGDIYGHYIGTFPVICIHDIELLKLIQIKDFEKFPNRLKFIKGGLDPTHNPVSLVELEGQRWKHVRSILRPTFSAIKLKQSVPLVHDAIDALLENIKAKDGGDFDIYPMLQGLTMDTIGRSAFGIKTDVQRNPDDPFLKAAREVFNNRGFSLATLPIYLTVLFPEFELIFYPLRYAVELIRAFLGVSHQRVLFRFSKQVVDQRRKMMEDAQNPRNDLLQHMLEASIDSEQLSTNMNSLTVDNDNSTDDPIEKSSNSLKQGLGDKGLKMTDEEIVANSVLFFEAGFETTSTMLAFVTHILVNHQDIQDKVREEINQLYDRQGRFDYNTVTELKYMDCVINETMRVYPPVTTFVERMALEDYKYKNITIPKGAAVAVPVYQIHHDPRHWHEPEKFDPERFAHGKVNPIIWQPFGAGPRNCIGMRFAILEAKLCLARLLREVKLVAGSRTEIGSIAVDYKPITMCPKNGVFVEAIFLNP